jgi:hypothetical protein
VIPVRNGIPSSQDIDEQKALYSALKQEESCIVVQPQLFESLSIICNLSKSRLFGFKPMIHLK